MKAGKDENTASKDGGTADGCGELGRQVSQAQHPARRPSGDDEMANTGDSPPMS